MNTGIKNPAVMFDSVSVEEFLSRLDSLSTAEAQNRYSHGEKFNFLKAILISKFEFLRWYIRHAGFLRGWRVLFFAYLMSVNRLSAQIKLWQKLHSSRD